MRLFISLCHKRGCTNIVRSGFRFCYKSDCCKSKPDIEGEEE